MTDLSRRSHRLTTDGSDMAAMTTISTPAERDPVR
jgi:hypothetical protein